MPESNAHADRRTKICAFLLVCLLAGVVFYPVVWGEFLHWDDDVNISLNPHLEGPAGQVLRWSFTDMAYEKRYQPLCWLTWAALRRCFGLDPFYFHLAVLMLHVINSGLVFLLIRRLLLLAWQKPENDSPRFSLSAALAAGVWAVHPLRVETTAWAVELAFLLPLFFFLLSLLSYLQTSDTKGTRAQSFYLASILFFAASLLAYPLVLGGFVVFVALDIYPLRRLPLAPAKWFTGPERAIWLQKVPFAIIALFFGWLNLHNRSAAHVQLKPPTLAEFGIVSRLMQAFFIWGHNVWKPFAPFHLTPIPGQLVHFNPFAPMFILSALLVVGSTAVLILLRRRWPGIFLIWICYLALLVPVLGFSEHPHYSSDRYSLIVDICGSIMLGSLLVKIWPKVRTRSVLLGSTVILICGLGALSRRQSEIWRTNIGFFQNLIAQLQGQPQLEFKRADLYVRLAVSYTERGNLAACEQALRTAIRTQPDSPKLYALLGNALELAGKLDEAKESFLTALELDPASLPTRKDLINVLKLQGKSDEASVYLEKLKSTQNQKSAPR